MAICAGCILLGAALAVACANLGGAAEPPLEASHQCRAHHTVVKGDTLLGIASRHDATVAEITWANAIPDEDLIFLGQRLCIPKRGIAPVGELVATSDWACRHYYRVQPGDTLVHVARAFETKVSTIVEANPARLRRSRENILMAGWGLCIP